MRKEPGRYLQGRVQALLGRLPKPQGFCQHHMVSSCTHLPLSMLLRNLRHSLLVIWFWQIVTHLANDFGTARKPQQGLPYLTFQSSTHRPSCNQSIRRVKQKS